MAETLYGPYECKGSIIEAESFAKGYDSPTWPTGFKQGRHGSFFEWHDQSYFVYCDISQTGNRYFRDSFISYIHYKSNGEIATVRVDGIGVANYSATQSKIEAEDFFRKKGVVKVEFGNDFAMKTVAIKSFLHYPKVKDLKNSTQMQLRVAASKGGTFSIVITQDDLNGKVLGAKSVKLDPKDQFQNITINLSNVSDKADIFVTIEQQAKHSLLLDNFLFLTQ
jgi:hypothetical protein